MPQRYSTTSDSQGTFTKILSYEQFKQGRKAKIQDYILYLLSKTDTGLSCRDISNISGIWVQSLTNPLKTLVEAKRIEIVGIDRSKVSNRLVLLYGMGLNPELK